MTGHAFLYIVWQDTPIWHDKPSQKQHGGNINTTTNTSATTTTAGGQGANSTSASLTVLDAFLAAVVVAVAVVTATAAAVTLLSFGGAPNDTNLLCLSSRLSCAPYISFYYCRNISPTYFK